MNRIHIGTYIQPSHQAKKKKYELITSIKPQDVKDNYYNQSNPYALNKNPSSPIINKPMFTPDHSNRDSFTQTNSQKSIKIVRSNGLNKVQKPNIANSQVSSTGSSTNIRISQVSPTNTSKLTIKYTSQNPQFPSPQKNGLHQKIKQYPQNPHFSFSSHLQQQNTNLKLQNIKLKQQLTNMKYIHNQQIKNIQQKIQLLFYHIKQLQQHINIQNIQWLNYQKILNK